MDQDNLFNHHLVAQGKLDYARGKRPNVNCIFCALLENHPDVEKLPLYETDDILISLNMYPYNPGHLMVIPKRHYESFEDLPPELFIKIWNYVIASQKLLRKAFSPIGFNVGYNQGDFSGASIKHIHVHVVPRYKTELGFIDIIGKTKVIVQTVSECLQKMKPLAEEFYGSLK
jgi:ATP adenylyltransferase